MTVLQYSYNVYVGWDSRETIAFDVCEHSIQEHTTVPVSVHPLAINSLVSDGLYWREPDIGSTEFTISRFLVPFLNDYQGVALFCDCDFLFECDIKQLFEQFDPTKAVQVVKHDYQPKETTKFLNNVQHQYPRKNWSSLVMWNCAHPANRAVDLNMVNSKEPSFLHQFKWLTDDLIGEISHEWNWLEGHYTEPQDGSPKAIHYTRGGPWFEDCQHVQYADRWLNALKQLEESKL